MSEAIRSTISGLIFRGDGRPRFPCIKPRIPFNRTLFTRLAGLFAMPVISAFKRRVDHRCYNGASLLGLRGIVIKSHGSADEYAFGFAIQRAVEEVGSGVLAHITDRMSNLQKSAA